MPPRVLLYSVIRRLLRATAGAALAILGFTPTTAMSQFQLGIFIGPPVPVESLPYSIRVRGATSNPPLTVTNVTIEVNQQFVDVTYYINHEADISSPAVYVGMQSGPLLPAGTYTFRKFPRESIFGGSNSDPGPPRYTATVIVTPVNNFVEAVEYYYPLLDHYFVTASATEIAALDAGVFPGWSRTGQKLPVYLSDPSIGGVQATVTPVCRFYGLPSAGLDTHFFSASPAECAAVEAKWPDIWLLETPTAFYVYLPNTADGSCPDGTVPVYRFYNNRTDVNHRYTTSAVIQAQMISAGWLPEGYGANTVAMCVP
jgi:hypothetical protein